MTQPTTSSPFFDLANFQCEMSLETSTPKADTVILTAHSDEGSVLNGIEIVLLDKNQLLKSSQDL